MQVREGEILDSQGRPIPGARIELTSERHGEDTLWRAELVNEGPELRPAFVRPLVLDVETDAKPEQIRFLLNGYSSFSGTGSFHLGETEIDSRIPWLRQVHRNLHLPRETKPGYLTSALFGVLAVPGQEPITVGFLGSDEHFTQVRTEVRGRTVRLSAQIQFEHRPIAAGAHLPLPHLLVGRGPAWRTLDRYMRLLAARLGVTPRTVPPGWCTWYHYFADITEAELDKNLQRAQTLREPVRIFQLDDGYQRALGDWTATNGKFPTGLRALAHRVTEGGFLPGLWTAPFFARKDSALLREHPEWILRDARGREVVGMWNPNWGALGFAYALDVTRPEFQQHLWNVFTRLYDDGFRFFKLDFLFAASLPGAYHDPTRTSFRALREALALIRRAVKDAYVLGCGCPLEAGIGLVDSMRVGNDVTPYWSNAIDRWIGGAFEQLSTKNCLRNTLARACMNERLFHSDPDCLITRRVRNELTPAEMRTLAQVNALSGGTIMISDDLTTLDEESLRRLHFAFELSKKVRSVERTYAAPDLLERRIPELQLALGPEDAWLGVYNFSERPAAKTVSLHTLVPWKRCRVTEHDSGRELEIRDGSLDAGLIEPHGARLFHLSAPSSPAGRAPSRE